MGYKHILKFVCDFLELHSYGLLLGGRFHKPYSYFFQIAIYFLSVYFWSSFYS